MKSNREIMNELARSSKLLYELSEEESAKLKSLLLSIYQDVANVCEEHSLTIMLIGGSALGAVRHKGFIPWDDDLDVCMPRSDYNKLIDLLSKGVLSDSYTYTTPSNNNDSKNNHLKIYRKNTTDAEIFESNMPFPKGVFLDVFCLENAPKPGLFTKLRGKIVDFIQMLSVSALFAQYPSKEYTEYMRGSKDAYKQYKLRLLLGKIALCIASHKKWAYWSDKTSQYSKASNYCTIPTGTRRYCGELLPKDVFFPVSKGVFEGIEVSLPHDVDKYLTNMYKNYMWIPPVEKRERHFVYKFSLTEEL